MTKNVEIFENEEAERFLDYYIAYQKLVIVVENVKCIAAVNGEMSLNIKEPTLPDDRLNEVNDQNLSITLPLAP